MRILLHACCGPCFIVPWEALTAEGHEAVGFFYNPNIHPLIEFRRRLKAMKVLQERLPARVVYDEQYGLRSYLETVRWGGDQRCGDCYRMRLRRTAIEACRRGFDAFSTTLLVSAHQAHDLVRRIGEEEAREHDVAFHYADWREHARETHDRAQAMRLYLQQYCGCIFSERERYADTRLHLYRGPGPRGGPDAAEEA